MQISPTGLPVMSVSGVSKRAYSMTPSLTRSACRGRAPDRRTMAAVARGFRVDAITPAGREEQKLAVGGLLELLGHQGIHAVAGHQHIEQAGAPCAESHVHGRDREVVQLAGFAGRSRRTAAGNRLGAPRHDVQIAAQRQGGNAAERGDHPAARVGHQEDVRWKSEILRPQFAGGVADGGLVAGAEGGAHVAHAAQDRLTEESSSVRAFQQRNIGLEAGLHFFFQAVRHGLRVMWRSTICPVMANSTVIATEVESRSWSAATDWRSGSFISWAPPGRCCRWSTGGYSLPYLFRCGAGMKPVSEMEIRGRARPVFGHGDAALQEPADCPAGRARGRCAARIRPAARWRWCTCRWPV